MKNIFSDLGNPLIFAPHFCEAKVGGRIKEGGSVK